MRHKHILSLLLAVLLLAACSPLRRTQRNQKADSTTVDRSEIRKAVTDILRESGTLSQTVIEFYPPVMRPPAIALPDGKPESRQPQPQPSFSDEDWNDGVGAALPSEDMSKPQRPAVKRIVHTEITAERERETSTDSTARNDIHTTLHTKLSDKVAEKPPAGTATIKWIAIALAAIAAIILLLKIPKIKLPRL
jgi:hypothetical protein